MAKTPTRISVLASQTKAAGTTTRGRADVSALDGGFLTLAITNGGTAPSAQAVGRILIAHKDTGGSMPSAGAEGTGDGDWKQVYEIGGGTVSGFKTRLPPWRFGPEVSYIEVEFPPHTGADVTIEAIVSGYTY